MPPHQHLEESIAHLRKELSSGTPLSAQDRELLDRTLAEVSIHLDDENPATVMVEPLYHELRELAARMEQSRPNLSILLGRIVDALSQLGI
ncbi:MAG: DUF4404 family protein [Myxococcota bacterium]